MTVSKFYLMFSVHGKTEWRKTRGYIQQCNGRWFGIHRDLKDPEHWNVVYLRNGMKVNVEKHSTIKSAMDALPQYAEKVETWYKDFRKQAKEYEKTCNDIYTNDQSCVALFWKLWPTGWVEE